MLTCTGVSFFHGSNDGQKGMGLIMLILIGTVPTAYALNHAVSPHDIQDFIAASERAVSIVDAHVNREAILGSDARAELTEYLRIKKVQPVTMTALREIIRDLEGDVKAYGDYKSVPASQQTNVRNDMYVTSETLRLMAKNHQGNFSTDETSALNNYKKHVDKATKFIPSWVKVAVALALGLGTMVGWKRIVVTVGEKIGKEHLTYAQGATAELVAMGTIFAADNFGLAGEYYACAEFRSSGHHGGQQERPATVHHPQHRRGLGVHTAGRRAALRPAVRIVPQFFGVKDVRKYGRFFPKASAQADARFLSRPLRAISAGNCTDGPWATNERVPLP